MAERRRYADAPLLAVVLPVAAGVAWYLWHSRVSSCGFRGLKGEPNFPATLALVVLVLPVPVVTFVRGSLEHRSSREIAGLVVLALVLALVAVGIAELAFISDRHCFE